MNTGSYHLIKIKTKLKIIRQIKLKVLISFDDFHLFFFQIKHIKSYCHYIFFQNLNIKKYIKFKFAI